MILNYEDREKILKLAATIEHDMPGLSLKQCCILAEDIYSDMGYVASNEVLDMGGK